MKLLEDWQEEKRSAFLYKVMASQEKNSRYKILFLKLASASEKQAKLWEKKINATLQSVPKFYKPDLRTKLVAFLITKLGVKRLRFVLPAMKIRGMSVFRNTDSNYYFKSTDKNHEKRHKSISSGGNLRAAVFGINDGLVSNTSLLLGVVGANADYHIVLLSGVAGLLAGACSMAAGEYVSVSSQRELYEYQIELEKNELQYYPDEEAQELAMIYHARGLTKQDAKNLAYKIIQNPKLALDTLAKEELGLNPNDLGSPWGAAISSFISFSIGAIVPLIPYFIKESPWNLYIMISLAGVSLFSVGATLSLFTNKNSLLSGFRMLLIGTSAGLVTYFVGMLLGVTLH